MQGSKWFAGLIVVSLAVIGFYYFSSTPPKQDYADLSPYALLDASDVRQTVKQALKNNDTAALDNQIEKIVVVARQMPLHPDDIAFLKGQEARAYLRFHASRALFDDAVIERFISLQPISDLKLDYPEAEDRFARADSIIAKRDALFKQIRDSLLDDGMTPNEANHTARALWRDRFDTQSVKQFIGQ